MARPTTSGGPAGTDTAGKGQVLDREAILGSALELVDEVGLAGLNMRALAQRLGVGTMSLYHHVPNKDALLDGIVEALLGGIEIPAADAGSWDERALLMARSLRAVALCHPHCVPLMVTRPFATGDALRPCEAAFDVLAEAGLSTEQALIAFRTIVAYVLGFVMMESAGFFGGVGPGRDPDELLELGLPRLAAMVPHLEGRDINADFDAGLRIVEVGSLAALAQMAQAPRQR
ncbi:MAG: TetR/AcrR family transcriptional regulator C-terminal domain-containing protein [Actinomycetota bacterium]|jgi:TetR/AcrR family transcriptional regulator, tetracycline repressor protein